jgi:membrane-associated protease RseP (regulator of RpoE activity)
VTSQPAIEESSAFARFMASGYGRIVRLAFGAGLVAAGPAVVPWPAGLALAAFGLVPIAAGVFNLCPVAPLWGGHFVGSRYCPSKKTTRLD